MVRCVGSSQDSTFLCLLAIYAVHLLVFHVCDVAPFTNTQPKFNRSTIILQNIIKNNGTAFLVKTYHESPIILKPEENKFSEYFEYQMSASGSSSKWYSAFPHIISSYSKINIDHVYTIYNHRIVSIFTDVALNSSTWGIIGGCAIFMLT